MKADANGNEEWNRTYGGTDGDSAFPMIQTTDGGYALAGYTLNYSVGMADFYLVKTDPLGLAQWDKKYVETGSDEVHIL